ARRTAGLAYNLGEETKPTTTRNTRANSKLVSLTNEEILDENTNEAESNPVRLVSLEVTKGSISRKSEDKQSKNPKTGLELSHREAADSPTTIALPSVNETIKE